VEEVDHLFIGGLGEVAVELADGLEMRGCEGADGLVGEGADLLEGAGRGDGNGGDDLFGLFGADGVDGGLHGRAGGEAIVNDDHGFVLEDARGPIAAVEGEVGLGLGGAGGDLIVEVGLGDIVALREEGLAGFGDGANGVFGLAGEANLLGAGDVEGET